MMAKKNTLKQKCPGYLLSLAGEYRVCSELNRRGLLATITSGNHKAVDVYVISRRERALRIEVKTTQENDFCTTFPKGGYTPESAPDFWVFFQTKANGDEQYLERFFVLTHDEMMSVQEKHNDDYSRSHNGKPHEDGAYQGLSVQDILAHEGAWYKIDTRLAKA
jgi:hypothetical protein